MATFTINQIQDKEIRELLFEAQRRGEEIADFTIGHKHVDCYTSLFIGMASILIEQRKTIEQQNINLRERISFEASLNAELKEKLEYETNSGN